MTSINAIMPSNIRITQRSNNNNIVLSKIIQDNKDSITAKSTTTFIIQNKKLELLKQQDASSSAFESTTITPTPESSQSVKTIPQIQRLLENNFWQSINIYHYERSA